MREGAAAAIRQVRERFAFLTTEKERRAAGYTHKQWAWIDNRVRMAHDDSARRRRHFRLAIAIPGSKTFMPKIPALGCRYAAPGSALVQQRKTFWKVKEHQATIFQGILNSMDVCRDGRFDVALGGDDFHTGRASSWQVMHGRVSDSELRAWEEGVSPVSQMFICRSKDFLKPCMLYTRIEQINYWQDHEFRANSSLKPEALLCCALRPPAWVEPGRSSQRSQREGHPLLGGGGVRRNPPLGWSHLIARVRAALLV